MRHASRIRMMVSGLGTAILLIGSTFASTAGATTIYSFDAFALTPSTTTANTTASNFSFTSAAGVTQCWATAYPNAACGGFGSAIGEFTVAPLAGYRLNITGLSFDERNAGDAGPTAFHVLTSADGFTSPIISGALAQDAPVFTHHAVSLSLFNLTDPFVVRLVATGRDDYPMSTWFLDNVTLNVEALPAATAVPEPTTLLLLGTGIGFIANRRRHRRRSIE
jgi:hypothetical protein